MVDKSKSTITRRGAISGTLLGLGGFVGWLTHRLGGPSPVAKTPPKRGDNPYAYDISEFRRTDPKTLLFEEAGEFNPGFKTVRRIATVQNNSGSPHQLMVTGDKQIRIFETDGELVRSIPLEHTPHCTHLSKTGELFVGYARHFDVHDAQGARLHSTERFSDRSFITAIATLDQQVFVADAGNREVILCDRKGQVQKRFGKVGDDPANPGFAVPSPYFDLCVNAEGKLIVANPGRLRVETYSAQGVFKDSWGEPGMSIDRFSGCCNPVFFTMTGDGGFVTSEKGLARVKLHDATGKLLGLVAGPDFLITDKKLVKRAGQAAGGFDVAMTGDGSVHVLDPYRGTVRSFRPLC